jgi:hypothetical protein
LHSTCIIGPDGKRLPVTAHSRLGLAQLEERIAEIVVRVRTTRIELQGTLVEFHRRARAAAGALDIRRLDEHIGVARLEGERAAQTLERCVPLPACTQLRAEVGMSLGVLRQHLRRLA